MLLDVVELAREKNPIIGREYRIENGRLFLTYLIPKGVVASPILGHWIDYKLSALYLRINAHPIYERGSVRKSFSVEVPKGIKSIRVSKIYQSLEYDDPLDAA